MDFLPAEFVMNYTFFGRAAEFFCGMFLAKIVLTKGVQPNLSRRPKFTVLGFGKSWVAFSDVQDFANADLLIRDILSVRHYCQQPDPAGLHRHVLLRPD